MFCSKCGKEIGAGVAFCQHCGNPVNASENASEPVKNNTGSFFRSLQEKAKEVSESISAAAEEAQKRIEEEKKEQEANLNINIYGEPIVKAEYSTGMHRGRFKSDFSFINRYDYIGTYVIVDRLTGVNYLLVGGRERSGLTVLVDENGKPLVTKEDKIEITVTEENEQNNAE